jgi:hypothetical protein
VSISVARNLVARSLYLSNEPRKSLGIPGEDEEGGLYPAGIEELKELEDITLQSESVATPIIELDKRPQRLNLEIVLDVDGYHIIHFFLLL